MYYYFVNDSERTVIINYLLEDKNVMQNIIVIFFYKI